jgi:hypothetical protein
MYSYEFSYEFVGVWARVLPCVLCAVIVRYRCVPAGG